VALTFAERTRRLGAVATLLLATVPAAAVASSARLAALGGNADYLPDEREVLRWYAAGVDHDHLVVFDLGRFDTGGGGQAWSDRIAGQAGGVHLRFDGEGRWGTAHAYFHTAAVQAAPSEVHADYPGGSFSLGWARRFGAWDMGAGFRGTTYAQTTGETDGGPAAGREDYRHDWGAGLRRRFADGGAVELAGEIRNVMFRMVDTAREISEPGKNDTRSYGVRARGRIPLATGVALVPLVDYMRDLQTVYSPQLADVAGFDAWMLRAGVACHLDRGDGQRLLVSCEIRDARENHAGRGGLYRAYDKLHRDWWSLFVRAAVESEPTAWLTLRVSLQYRRIDDEAVASWFGQDATAGDVVDARRVVDVPLGLGVAVHHGRFDLDASYNDVSPLSTPDVPDANASRETANFAILSLRYAY
jgi:hypothetical protein